MVAGFIIIPVESVETAAGKTVVGRSVHVVTGYDQLRVTGFDGSSTHDDDFSIRLNDHIFHGAVTDKSCVGNSSVPKSRVKTSI